MQMLCLKNVFYSLKPINIGVNSFKNEYNECNIKFLLIQLLNYTFFPYHGLKICR